MERIYHGYEVWEDFKEGMYQTTCFMDPDSMIKDCVMLLTCPEWLEECMSFVIHNWEFSAQHNLTNMNRNRQAWLGQAACCFAHGAPEYITKLAWNKLTEEEQLLANNVADRIIKVFENKFKIGVQTCLKYN